MIHSLGERFELLRDESPEVVLQPHCPDPLHAVGESLFDSVTCAGGNSDFATLAATGSRTDSFYFFRVVHKHPSWQKRVRSYLSHWLSCLKQCLRLTLWQSQVEGFSSVTSHVEQLNTQICIKITCNISKCANVWQIKLFQKRSGAHCVCVFVVGICVFIVYCVCVCHL